MEKMLGKCAMMSPAESMENLCHVEIWLPMLLREQVLCIPNNWSSLLYMLNEYALNF